MNNSMTYSSREFTRDVAAAKRASHDGAVFITDRGQPAYVLLDMNTYTQLTEKNPQSLLEMMNQIPSADAIDFEPETIQIHTQMVDFD